MRRALLAILLASSIFAEVPTLPSLREQDRIQQEWLRLRLDRHLPTLMRKYGAQMWIVACREYAEDPAFFSLVSATVFAARRTTIYVFYDRGADQPLERLALGGDSNGGLYTVYRDPDSSNKEIYGETQWQLLRKLVDQRHPSTIAIDISPVHAFSDGLTVGMHDKLMAALGPDYKDKIIPAENLALEYQELRLPEMLPVYRNMMEIVHSLISRAFSNEVIVPGKTTNEDVVWWLRQKVNDAGLGTWFQPSVTVQRKGLTAATRLNPREGEVIQRGDVLHTDFGITAMRLNTDTQRMGYVLREGETTVPAGIQAALRNTDRLQDLLLERMRPGRTGNEVLGDVLHAMHEEKIDGSVYTHPIGDHGHAAGPLIGLWDLQQGVPGRGDAKLVAGSWFSIELQATTPVPEWDGQKLVVALEEDAALDEQGKMSWILKRQTEYHLVK
ncbi:MAG TPA: M24 family metallopeptidase [Bryobacteraceae bacterium]|nr:M24 family metallopeptidase [Bryobacteraceae bacterium]